VKGRLDRVIANLRETIRLRNERRVPMQIEVGLILMRHNEHEAEAFRNTILAFGADEAAIIDPCVRTIEQGKQFLPVNKLHWIYDEQAFARGVLKPKVLPDNVCPWIYYSIAIHVNGNVVPCCRDPRGEEVMGNIFEQELEEIWNGPKFRQLRERIRKDQGAVGICRLCSSYPASKVH
jgi:radical SAM protein with 4Fe4S-binding SPASM domain